MRSEVLVEHGRSMAWWRSIALAWLLFWLVFGVWGAEVSPAARFQIHQPAQPLADSLTAISRQTGRSLLFNPVLLEGRKAQAISGQMSAEEAMVRLLQGTGLVLEQRAGALVVRAGPSVAPADAQPAASTPSSLAPARTNVVLGYGERLALAGLQTASDAEAGAAAAAAARAPASAPSSTQKIEVTGTRLKRIEAETALPVNVYTRAEIEKSGQPSLGLFLAGLNEVSMGQGDGAFSGTTQGQGSVQLRGLPLGSTLVLINGRRMQMAGSSGATFFSLNLIPLAAVERVEVVPVGSSAVYGGDALAGVVNVILRKSIEGMTLSARLTSGKGFGDGAFSLGAGGSSEEGGWLLLGSFSRSTPLLLSEREFFRDADYRRFGGIDARERNCAPGTVTSSTAANLPGLNSTFAAIPNSGQPLTVASFTASAGQANLCNNLSNASASSLMHGTESMGVHASAYRTLSGSLTAFGELSLVSEEAEADGLGLNLNNVLVPASNPYNPFGAPVRVTARLGTENGGESYRRTTNFVRTLLGVRGEIGAGWDFEAAASMSRDQGRRVQFNSVADATARTNALATTDRASALNPFTAGRAASDEVLGRIWSNSVRRTFGRKTTVSAFARGPVAELPAGAVETIVGGEAAWDDYQAFQTGANIDASRRSGALYGEARVPLWQGGGTVERSWTLAALTLAARRDRYSDVGSADTYQAGLEIRPARTLLLRASAATSFKPPNLVQTNVDEQLIPLASLRLVDPLRGNEPVTSTGLRVTNKDLRPETGKAYSLGTVWEPGGAQGSRLAATVWDVRIDNLIGFLLPQLVVNNPGLFPGFVTRGPSVGGVPGPITQLQLSETNFGFVRTQGIDLEAARSWQGPMGRWSVGASATHVMVYDVSFAPGVPEASRLGRRFGDNWAPKWKARLSAGLDTGSWSLGVSSRYLATYKDTEPSDRTVFSPGAERSPQPPGWLHRNLVRALQGR